MYKLNKWEHFIYKYCKLDKEFLELWANGEDRWSDCKLSKANDSYMQ